MTVGLSEASMIFQLRHSGHVASTILEGGIGTPTARTLCYHKGYHATESSKGLVHKKVARKGKRIFFQSLQSCVHSERFKICCLTIVKRSCPYTGVRSFPPVESFSVASAVAFRLRMPRMTTSIGQGSYCSFSPITSAACEQVRPRRTCCCWESGYVHHTRWQRLRRRRRPKKCEESFLSHFEESLFREICLSCGVRSNEVLVSCRSKGCRYSTDSTTVVSWNKHMSF